MMNYLPKRAVIKFWRNTVPRLRMRVGHTQVRVSGYNSNAGALFRWREGWKTEIIRRVFAIEDGDFVDVGANVGQTLLDYCAAGIKCRYIGFEPNPTAFASLHIFIRDNDLKNCVLLPIGLSDTASVLNLYSQVSHAADVNATIVADLRPRMTLDQTPIVCCRFDDLRAALGIASIGLIKIDVEGAELAVLRGMEGTLRELRTPVLCEILYADKSADLHQYGEAVKSTIEFLHQIDYAVFRVLMDRTTERFVGLRKMADLPTQVWSPDNSHECDYILIPTEKVCNYEQTIAGGSAKLG